MLTTTATAGDAYRVYAVRYACHPTRRADENLLGADPHDGPMPMDYFVWAILGRRGVVVVDTGFDAATAARRGRQHLRCPGDGLRRIGVDPGDVREVVLSHLHYDHAGNHDLFPNARFHVQDRELAYVTGRAMDHALLRAGYEEADVVAMVRRLFAGRLAFHDGDARLAAGVSLHLIGGHTRGMQAVRVETRNGPVVLASDAAHYYANVDEMRPFPGVVDVGATLEGYRTLRRLAGPLGHLVPGHDPRVTTRYPPAAPGLDGIAVRLDVALVPRSVP